MKRNRGSNCQKLLFSGKMQKNEARCKYLSSYRAFFITQRQSVTSMLPRYFKPQRYLNGLSQKSLFNFFFSFHAAAFGAILHVISTSLLGITAITMANTIAGEETVHKLASLLLVFLGGMYIVLFVMGKGGHSHSHNQPMEKMAVAGLILVPALSPCATTLPVFLAVGNSSSMMVLAIIVLLFRYKSVALLIKNSSSMTV